MRYIALALTLATALVSLAACDDSKPSAPAATQTPRALPSPVAYRPEPQGIALADPAFEALSGAEALHGTLGGSAYQIEVPDDWNGSLVLYMHGFQGLAPEAEVEPPGIRTYLVRNGFAWGASSYSSTALIPGRAADETAALWDFFAQKYGRPQRTYVTGHSMGGAATHIAVERYPDRFDGGLGLCGYAGQAAISSVVGDVFIVGAYVAGVTQQEYDESVDIYEIINGRIRPALRDEATHERFINILLGMTGGPRAFDREGFLLEEETNWERTGILTAAHLYDNDDRGYRLGALSGVADADFNGRAIRVKPSDNYRNFLEGNEITGDIKVPLLTMHTTGDWQTPIDQQQILRERVEAAGKGDLLVQRLVREAGHCNFTGQEWETGLEDLIAWVEDGRKPDGEDVLVDDLRQLGGAFTLSPRFGSAEAERVPGAGERVALSGSITLDGAPFDGFIWFDIERDGLPAICNFAGEPASGGRYERTLAADTEVRGCGAPGAMVRLRAFADGTLYGSDELFAWPVAPGPATFDYTLRPYDSQLPLVYGGVTDASGRPAPPGTQIEAYVGDTLCGVTSTPHVSTAFTPTSSYLIVLAGSESVDGCAAGGTIAFRIDGATTTHTAPYRLQQEGVQLDLVLP